MPLLVTLTTPHLEMTNVSIQFQVVHPKFLSFIVYQEENTLLDERLLRLLEDLDDRDDYSCNTSCLTKHQAPRAMYHLFPSLCTPRHQSIIKHYTVLLLYIPCFIGKSDAHNQAQDVGDI